MKNKISVIIPIYNELNNLPNLLERLHESLSKIGEYELIFIDDHSTDKTSAYFKKFKADNIFLHLKKGKKGKAYSLIEGFEKATGDVLVMIDADLQYPPEVIGEMMEKLQSADIVVANRVKYNDSLPRRVLSKTFRKLFGQYLFGINSDIQSGMKMFKKEVVDFIKFTPSSAWTFDLEFLHRATHAGFKIANFDITFEKRKAGTSSVRFVKTTFDIGLNSLFLRLKALHPLVIAPKEKKGMLGAGIRFKKNKYVTHTTLSHHRSALTTFTLNQKVIIFFLLLYLGIGLVFKPLLTLQLSVGILSFIYFVDVFFNLYLIIKSLSFPQEVSSSQEEIEGLKDKDLPVYSILCPLYKEAHVIPQFLDAISKIEWPKEKLDVILLLEEDDKVSIEAVEKMDMPSYVRTIVVPDSQPKTKPKACNYGLAFAKGEYLVIYDAEDIPDPLQLKKAFLGFKKVSENTICLQAKLNYYNPHQNLLTRFFTAEYSLWFDVTLTGLQSIETTIPLGGTSNHFRIKYLHEVEGWDPFNVTEDADLGIRLFKRGYKTAIIDSVTLEEANSKYKNWLRQRSRWIKGYMQTYLVHIRDVFTFTREHKKHSLIFQLIIGGKIAFVLINPLLWIATLAYFALYAFVGPQIEKLYPSIVFYMAVVSLVLGNFLFLYYYMIGVAKKGQWALMKYVFLIPFYWLMISIAAGIALYQLIFKPHYWEKTVHGLHLLGAKNKALDADQLIGYTEQNQIFAYFSNIKNKAASFVNKRRIFVQGFYLIAAINIANVLSYLFSAYLGRVLDFDDFAIIALISSLSTIVAIPANALSTTVNHHSAYLIGKDGIDAGAIFWNSIKKVSIVISLVISLVWILLTPILSVYFKIPATYLALAILPLLLTNFIFAVNRGFLYGKLMFGAIALIYLMEPLMKLVSLGGIIFAGFGEYVFLSIPAGSLIAFLVSWYFNKNQKKIFNTKLKFKFPWKFFFVSLLSGLSTVSFLSIDIVLAKHFLSMEDAGKYALISLVGKMIFFFGSLGLPFVMPLASRLEGKNEDSKSILKYSFLVIFIFSSIGYLTLGVFGGKILPVLLGDKINLISEYLLPYSTAIFCFTISQVFVSYYQSLKKYSFSFISFLIAILQIGLIYLFHDSIGSIIYTMMGLGLINLIVFFVLHKFHYFFSDKFLIIKNNVVDLFDLVRSKGSSNKNKDNLNILIFNWRDTKHTWSGGAEVYINELAKRWAKDKNNVTIFCGNDGKSEHTEVKDGVQIYRRGGFYTVYIWAMLYYIFKFRGKYDVIIDSENGIPFFTPLYTRVPKFLLIHHVHQEVFRKSLKWPLSWIALFLEAKLMPFVYRKTQVITVSPSSKEEILKHKLTKTEPIIIYNGVDVNLFKPAIKSKTPLVLYLGRLQYYKSLHVFIISAKRIIKKIPNAKFVIAGEGEEKERLIKLATEKGMLGYIQFLGKVTEQEKIKLMQQAWVFVNPSFMEGWGITTIEANACATPAVASNVPGLKDSIKHGETGILEKYGKYQGFSRSIIKLISDNKLRKEMSANAHEWSKNYTWENSAIRFYSLLVDTVEMNKNDRFRFRKINIVFNRLTSLF